MKISMKMIGKETLDKRLKQLKDKSAQMPAFANRVLYPMYQNFQRTRWMTEGKSEGFNWPRLNPAYAKRKKIIYKSAPGSGTKMMIASGRLFSSVIGPSDQSFRKVVTPYSLTISTTLSYAPYAARIRPMMLWGKDSKAAFRNAIQDFMRDKK